MKIKFSSVQMFKIDKFALGKVLLFIHTYASSVHSTMIISLGCLGEFLVIVAFSVMFSMYFIVQFSWKKALSLQAVLKH